MDWSAYGAALFDLDGVLTRTAVVHAAAWKSTFDAFLFDWEGNQQEFDIDTDYVHYVDGRPRYEGVAAFLDARGISLPWGTGDDLPGHDTVCAIGNRKNAAFVEMLQSQGADVYPGSIALLDYLDAIGMPMAVVSASENCGLILESVGLASQFMVQIDGLVASELGLAGKPDPDPFLEAARRLNMDPARCVVIEDAVSGVAAGSRGGFGLVVGVDRHGEPGALSDAGADLVVADLGDLVSGAEDWQAYPFSPEPWGLTRDGLDVDVVGLDEAIFALGNGNLGVRAAFEQGTIAHEPGTLLSGFYESWPIVYPEPAYGYAVNGQTIVYVPDAGHLSVSWDGSLLDLADARLRRRLDFRTGILTTTAEWPQVVVTWERLVSLRHDAVLAIRMTADVRADGVLGVQSRIINRQDLEYGDPGSEDDPRRARGFGRGVLHPGDQVAAGNVAVLTYRTCSSDLLLAVASRVTSSLGSTDWSIVDGNRASLDLSSITQTGDRHTTEVVVAHLRDDNAAVAHGHVGSIGDFAALAAEQAEEFDELVATSDVTIEGDPTAQHAVRWAIFQLHQASAAVQRRGIGAKGLTGQAYEGHHFWDTDVFVLPFLSATNPAAAREVIRFRHATLPKARERAATMTLRGALYPWRTITGDEASAFFEAGTAQYHINADVIHGLRTYLAWTGDDSLLWECGVEMAVETARMWASLGFWDDDGFHIHGVTGPDEYTALVNDNAYTNQMARMNLRFAAASVERMSTEEHVTYEALASAIGLSDDEVRDWVRIANRLVVIHDENTGVTAQDSTFLTLQPWDWATPRDRYPLLLNFHPLVIYRHRMLKQADVVMAHFVLPKDTTLEQQRADFDYYDPITTGDSSLSPAIQATVAARVGRSEKAWRYFREAAMIDLADHAGNAADGVHLACAAGIWLAVVRGFAGLDIDDDGAIHTDAKLPDGWDAVTINLQIRGEPFQVRVPSL